MNLEQRIALLEYELEHLRWCDRIQISISDAFGLSIDEGVMLPCANYKLLGMILDDLRIPEEHHDEIYGMYFDLLVSDTDEESLTEQIKTFLLQINEVIKGNDKDNMDSFLEEIDKLEDEEEDL